MANKSGKKGQKKKNTPNSKKEEIKMISTIEDLEETSLEKEKDSQTFIEQESGPREETSSQPVLEEQKQEEIKTEVITSIVETNSSNLVMEEETLGLVEVPQKVEIKEKSCPNCKTKIIGKYCANCGAYVAPLLEDKSLNLVTEEIGQNNLELSKEESSSGTSLVSEEISLEQISVVNPVTVPKPILPVVDSNSSTEVSEPIPLDVTLTTPPVNPMGVPGIMPIPNAGMNHNVMNYQKINSNNHASIPKRSHKLLLGISILIVLIGGLLIYFLIIQKEGRNTTIKNKDTGSNVNSNFVSNSSNQEELEEEDVTKLSCTLKEENFQEGIDSTSVIIYVFKKNILIKTINEESLEFSSDSLKYYGYYEGALKEMLEEELDKFDNTTLEMEKTENTITSIYSVDLTANPSNPRNNLDELGYTYSQAKKELEKEGYICK